MNARPPKGVLLAVHPTSRGFGWVVLDDTGIVVDWGIASARPGRDARLVARFERLLRRYQPSALAIEEFEGRGIVRSNRVRELCLTMVRLASAQGTPTMRRERHATARLLGFPADATRHQIAEAVAARLPALDHRLPARRKAWTAEDRRQALFDAAALALTATGIK